MIINDPIVFIVGPTGTGKSKIALELALEHQGSIINFDSVQFYQGLEIGSAAPAQIDKSKVPHHLYSYVRAPFEMTVGVFLRDLKKLLQNENLRFPLFFVGGTGFYQKALENGLHDVVEISDVTKNEIIVQFRQGKEEQLFQELSEFDPDHGLHRHDHYRVGRALELKRELSVKVSEQRLRPMKKIVEFKTIKKIGIDLDKMTLQERIVQRSRAMIASGLIEETQFFLDQGLLDWAPLNAVGFKETKDYLLKKITKEELESCIVTSTMQLIKKQRTWFKRDETLLWSDTDSSKKQIREYLDQQKT